MAASQIAAFFQHGVSPTSPGAAKIKKKRKRSIIPAAPLIPKSALLLHASTGTNTFAGFFQSHNNYDLVPTSAKIVVLDTALSARKAFYALIHNGIRAGILWSCSTNSYIGLLTISDFIWTILHHDNISGGLKLSSIEDETLGQWMVRHGSSKRPFISMSADGSILEAIAIMNARHVHRLPIISPDSGDVVTVLSHKRILKFFHMCMRSLCAAATDTTVDFGMTEGLEKLQLLRKSLRETGTGTFGDIETTTPNETIGAVLTRFLDTHVSAFPVVDTTNGNLITVFSRFDAIFLAADGSYVNLDVTPLSSILKKTKQRAPAMCHPDEPLGVVIERLVAKQVHRLVATADGNIGKPIGIVSLSDILCTLAGLQVLGSQLSSALPPGTVDSMDSS